MSLQVWLPLNGNLNNQGLDTITISGTPTYGPGKLAAQAYDLKNRCTFTVPSLVGAKTWSVAFWYITNTDTSLSSNWVDVLGFTDQKSDNSATGQYRFETCYGSVTNDGISQHDNGTYATHDGFGGYLVTTFGAWHHICTTIDYENNICVAYVDGIKLKTTTHNGGHLTGSVWLGETDKINGYLQDVRIYDHALSAKEVKEISQGLIIHLPLNDLIGNDNLLKNSTQGAGISQTTYNLQDYNFSKALVAGTTYTITCKMNMSDEKKAFAVYHSGGSIMCGPWIVNAGSGVYTWSFEATSQMASQTAGGGYGYARVYVSNNNGPQGSTALSGTANVDWIKIEEGTVSTGFIPNSADALYNTLGLNSGIVHDISGYVHNGTMSATKPTVFTDSARYGAAMSFSGSSYVFIQDINIGNVWSYGLWFKSASGSRGWEGLVILNTNGGDADMQLGFYTNPSGSKLQSTANGQYNSGISHTFDNTWHHLFATFDGSSLKTYRDGVLIDTKSISNTLLQRSNLTIGARCRGSSYDCYYTGQLSDLRIYATVLSAADILDLYNKPVSIDNTGKVHAIEYREV